MKTGANQSQHAIPKIYDKRAVADTTRYPEGGTSRALTGPEGEDQPRGVGREGTKPEESRPDRNNPKHQEQKKAKQPNRKHRTTATREKNPAAPRKENYKESAEAKGHPTQRDNQSRQQQWYHARLRTVHRQLAADRFPPGTGPRS